MKSLGVIPARYDSSRFPGKPLALILGKPMIQWVYEKAIKSNLDEVIIATDDNRIVKKIEEFGGKYLLTSKEHNNGTSRVAEVANTFSEYDLIINIQGDEPLISELLINNLLNNIKDAPMISAMKRMDKAEEINSPDNVKVVCDNSNYALYFSRSPIPFDRDTIGTTYYKHIGIYGYNRNFLFKYIELNETPLEKIEKLEQLRVLENGYKIKMVETNDIFIGVDRPEDIQKVESFLNNE